MHGNTEHHLKPISKGRLLAYAVFSVGCIVVSFTSRRPQKIVPLFASWLLGLMFWTLTEYLIHRFLFHTWGKRTRKRLIPALLTDHGNHHKVPEAMATGFLNPLYVVPLLAGIAYTGSLGFGPRAFIFFSGFTAGYIIYICTHFIIHRKKPPFPWLLFLWRHHYMHHFHNPHTCYGVTTILWDKLFATWAPSDRVDIDSKK